MEPPTAAAPAPPTERPPQPHVVLLASPGAGHLIPLAELARRLVGNHGVTATLVTFADRSTPDALPRRLPACVATATLPAVALGDLPPDAGVEIVLLEIVRRSLPRFRELLRSISSAAAPLVAVVPDLFCSSALPLAAELGVPGYLFFPGNLTALALVRRAVEFHNGAAPGEYSDLPDPFELPGGVLLRRTDLPDGFRGSNSAIYAHVVDDGRQYRGADGFLVNSFDEMEPAAVEEFRQAAEQGTFPPAYPVGPLVRPSSDDAGDVEAACLEWLDRQPPGSVVYVSFGSAGELSVEQTVELAAGLEASGERFLWVVRKPSHGQGDVDEEHGRDQSTMPWLPEGFVERTSSRGLAVAAWVPQVSVLSHPATAGFVSHCGWNSTLESVAAGVPMMAWPLFAEQKMNAVVLEEKAGVALRTLAPDDGGGVVPREEIAAAVTELLEGEKGRAARRKAGELMQEAARAWSPEGSSRRALEEVAAKWKAALGEE